MRPIIVNDINGDIPVIQMKNGEIGVITKWGTTSSTYIGLIVTKNDTILSAFGSEHYWSQIPTDEDCRVRLLKSGTLIKLV